MIGPSESSSFLLLSFLGESSTTQTTRHCTRETERSSLLLGSSWPVLTLWFTITNLVWVWHCEERDRNHLLKWLLHDAAFSNKAFQQHFRWVSPIKLPQRAPTLRAAKWCSSVALWVSTNSCLFCTVFFLQVCALRLSSTLPGMNPENPPEKSTSFAHFLLKCWLFYLKLVEGLWNPKYFTGKEENRKYTQAIVTLDWRVLVFQAVVCTPEPAARVK